MFSYSQQHEFDSKQFGYVNITQTSDNNLSGSTKFSNGKKIDGDNFRASIALKGSDVAIVAAVDHKAGLDASFGGSARERTLLPQIELPKSKIESLQDVEINFTHQDEVDDEKFWNTVKEIAEAVWEAYQANEK